ncbi:putative fad-dependent oxygenase protein [Botrytis fragariae]|uniref:Putative fad-dependent oxygenase protein n=1 Tax=Botrytis fragariae TaxID=1964551 RepID=A0A8H6AS57_9HELO|nr:putative fad-dependent oxygenase protein [Botrytis fragariae]KAF5872601.1 putative fad-dependent oxygenase protein [Botrytis fragariae]
MSSQPRKSELTTRSVTGICELVGFSAPTLGGGHGWLQGQYGPMADQVISARLLLPSGELVTANRLLRDQPAELVDWGYIIKGAEIDPDHPVLCFGIIYNGFPEKANQYARPFHDIEPLSVQTSQGSLHDLAVVTFQDADGPGCAYGMTSLRYPIGLKSYNATAVRQVYNEIDSTFRQVPEIAGSFFLLEGYSIQAVKAIDAASKAFPHRDDNILVTSYVMYAPDSNIDPIAKEFGEKLRKYLLDGSDDPEHLRAYVNYANGDESSQAIYGWETWRLEKLKKLKAQWDPKNTMRYYVPIEQSIN